MREDVNGLWSKQMGRIIFVPQFPAEMRYQEWWLYKFEKEFKKNFEEVIVLGKTTSIQNKNIKYGKIFSPVNSSVEFELDQIKEYISLDIKKDDVLFLSDISFPGLFCNILYHKKCSKMFAFCHATSINKFDYFEKDRNSKFYVESSNSILFDKIFVGSNYHKEKLINMGNDIYWKNTEVVYLPKPTINIIKEDKIYNIISVARPTIQKVNKEIEDKVEKNICRIIRKQFTTWDEYYKFLSRSKILLISSHEDTFNYTILEAIMCDTIVLAPNKLCFPELLPEEYLYNDYKELEQKINIYLKNYKNIPKLKCEKEVNEFFKHIINLMEI